MIKICTIVGARPQFVKAAALSNELKSYSNIVEIIVHTGQHYDKNMSKVFFNQLKIPEPNYHLMSGGKSHGAMTGYQLIEIEKILISEKPDWVIVYGDTNSTLAGAIAASKLKIPIVHIEAGLRSFNMKMPEEINRILTDRLSKILFCPSVSAVNNLKSEGFEKYGIQIEMVGDIMFDAFKLVSSTIEETICKGKPFVMCTLHREENIDDGQRLKKIFEGLNSVARNISIRIPLHPRTKKKLQTFDLKLNPNIIIEKPLPYIDFISAMSNCEIIISDSGGIQKEAYFSKKNCIILRDETEWIELINNKNNILVGCDTNLIIQAFQNRKSLNQDFSKTFYGKSNTANLIIEKIINAEIK
tara:strand:+ start:525 stop:1598 length:1074 start_codon:yes stop_codon:yes gene_type:complete